MPLSSPRFASNARLQSASTNSPAMFWGERGPAVEILQQAFVDLGYPMPISTAAGKPDGAYGAETYKVVKQFQSKWKLMADGITGAQTLAKLDSLFPGPVTPPDAIAYTVPGMKILIAQPTSMVCWATVHCMMRMWKFQQSLEIRPAAAAVDEKYGVMVDQNKGLPPAEFQPFIAKAGMAYEPMASYPIDVWLDWLQTYGLLWVGTMNSIGPSAGRHSRIIRGIAGTGQSDTTYFSIMDPAGGIMYQESFSLFIRKYENAIADNYYQVRHFA